MELQCACVIHSSSNLHGRTRQTLILKTVSASLSVQARLYEITQGLLTCKHATWTTFFQPLQRLGEGSKVNCHRSHRGSSWVKILETFPLNQDTMARFHRSAPQPPRGLNTSVCLLDGEVPRATKPRPFPQSTPHLMLMFKWAYWFSPTLYSVCVNYTGDVCRDTKTSLQEVVSCFLHNTCAVQLHQDLMCLIM